VYFGGSTIVPEAGDPKTEGYRLQPVPQQLRFWFDFISDRAVKPVLPGTRRACTTCRSDATCRRFGSRFERGRSKLSEREPRKRGRITRVVFAVLGAAVIGAMIFVSHDTPCPEEEPLLLNSATMMAITYRCYGDASVLRLAPVPRPVPGDDEILVRVHTASLNPADWHYMQGKPFIVRISSGWGRPEGSAMGTDFAGTVVSVGRNVTRYAAGDEVFGARTGAFAEYLTIREDRIVEHKPANVSFAEAAAVGVAATTALQAVRDHGGITAGQRVLINGASGGVGTFAVQIAKVYGADVTGVSSTRNVDLVLSLGADHVVDYTREDFTQGAERYDVIIDMVGNHRLRDLRRTLTPGGTVVIVGGPKDNRWIGPLARGARAAAYSPFTGERFAMFIAGLNPEDLRFLRDLMESGQLRSVIDGSYSPLRWTTCRTRGKNVIFMGANP
jgi:NADPH:quinone reductase-like Zn-dependent oxidoreductase